MDCAVRRRWRRDTHAQSCGHVKSWTGEVVVKIWDWIEDIMWRPESAWESKSVSQFPRSLLYSVAFIPVGLARQLPYAICKYLKLELILHKGATLNLLSFLGGFKIGKWPKPPHHAFFSYYFRDPQGRIPPFFWCMKGACCCDKSFHF